MAVNDPARVFLRAGVGIIALRNRKVLLGRRLGPRSPGQYGLPGGFVNEGETFVIAARREIQEETGWDGHRLYPIFVIAGRDNEENYIDAVFYYGGVAKDPAASEKDRVEGWEWFDILSLPTPLYDPSRLALENFIRYRWTHRINVFLQRTVLRAGELPLLTDTMRKS